MRKVFEFILSIVGFIIALILGGIITFFLFIANVWILNKFLFPFDINGDAVNVMAIIFTGIQMFLFPKIYSFTRNSEGGENAN